MIKIREFKESNYRGIWFNGKTIRIALDPSKPILELQYPEFYDVDIFETMNGLCRASCPWCYLKASTRGTCVMDALEKITEYFGKMTINERPFQVAIPGSGELFEHPRWKEILEAFHSLDIVPNYTTNGMFVDQSEEVIEDILKSTVKYCGGVAVSCHQHIKSYWEKAIELYSKEEIKLNLHIIISDKESIDNFTEIYEKYKDKIDYFVLLPYGNQGRAPKKEIDWEYLITKLPEDQSKLAFGANFYPYLLSGKHNIKISLYEPEILSKFIGLDNMKLYSSSFNTGL